MFSKWCFLNVQQMPANVCGSRGSKEKRLWSLEAVLKIHGRLARKDTTPFIFSCLQQCGVYDMAVALRISCRKFTMHDSKPQNSLT